MACVTCVHGLNANRCVLLCPQVIGWAFCRPAAIRSSWDDSIGYKDQRCCNSRGSAHLPLFPTSLVPFSLILVFGFLLAHPAWPCAFCTFCCNQHHLHWSRGQVQTPEVWHGLFTLEMVLSFIVKFLKKGEFWDIRIIFETLFFYFEWRKHNKKWL